MSGTVRYAIVMQGGSEASDLMLCMNLRLYRADRNLSPGVSLGGR